jgi:hypothetical protein
MWIFPSWPRIHVGRIFLSDAFDIGLDNPRRNRMLGLALTARTCALQNCMLLIPKTKRDAESGPWNSNNSFILNNMAERVGFESA